MKLVIYDDKDNEICAHHVDSTTLCDEDFINGLIDEIEDAELADDVYGKV